MHNITVVTLSTGDIRLLTAETTQALKQATIVVLRTARHPVAVWLTENDISYTSMDDLYNASETFDAFNAAAVHRLAGLAEESDVVYAISDMQTDATVAGLLAWDSTGETVRILPGVSHSDRCLAMARVAGKDVRLLTAEAFLQADALNPRISCFISELHSKVCAGACKLKLLNLLDGETPMLLFTGGEAGELHMRSIPLYELDRQQQYDHLTACLYIDVPMEERTRFGVDDLFTVMQRLRAKGGCPWDQEQTHESLLPNLLEESYEFIEAVQEADETHMTEELGDVLLQIIFHAVIAQQCGEFNLADVSTAVTVKLIERHPHVFGSVRADTADEVLDNWEAIKRRQRGLASTADAMDNVSKGLSPLLRASKVQKKAAKVGFDFPDAKEALEKVPEEYRETLESLTLGSGVEEELGDLLFSVVNVCRLAGVNPDLALHGAIRKFIGRFRGMENTVKSEGKSFEDLTLTEMDVYWLKEKRMTEHNSD